MKQQQFFENLTDKIAASLENAGKWSKPWGTLADSENRPRNAISGNVYNGVNSLVLSLAGINFNSCVWLTFKQAQQLGGSVKKGEKGEQIIYFKKVSKTEKNNDGEQVNKGYAMLRVYTVFNLDQCENITGKIKEAQGAKPTYHAEQSKALQLANELQATIDHNNSDRACFIPSLDQIHMPLRESFQKSEDYEATLAHELTHWTGHSSRLDRLKGSAFGSREYAFEELVAELGSAMVSATFGIDYAGLQHDKYIASWLRSLDNDKKYVYDAARLAQKAVNYMIENSEIMQTELTRIEAAA